jgi:hypothetical protein
MFFRDKGSSYKESTVPIVRDASRVSLAEASKAGGKSGARPIGLFLGHVFELFESSAPRVCLYAIQGTKLEMDSKLCSYSCLRCVAWSVTFEPLP